MNYQYRKTLGQNIQIQFLIIILPYVFKIKVFHNTFRDGYTSYLYTKTGAFVTSVDPKEFMSRLMFHTALQRVEITAKKLAFLAKFLHKI